MDQIVPDGDGVKSSQKVEDEPDLDTCAICLEHIRNRAVATPCNHLDFCFICLLTWLEQQTQCPLCKAEVLQIEYDWQNAERYKILRVARLKHKRSPRRPIPQPVFPRDLAFEARQNVYRNGITSSHIGCNPYSGYRTFTADEFSKSTALMRRARMFLRRELKVFPFLRPGVPTLRSRARSRVQPHDYLIEFIVAVLRCNEIKGEDGKAEDLVAEFLGRKSARLLLHELQSWLQCPYETLEDWDDVVQYITELD